MGFQLWISRWTWGPALALVATLLLGAVLTVLQGPGLRAYREAVAPLESPTDRTAAVRAVRYGHMVGAGRIAAISAMGFAVGDVRQGVLSARDAATAAALTPHGAVGQTSSQVAYRRHVEDIIREGPAINDICHPR